MTSLLHLAQQDDCLASGHVVLGLDDVDARAPGPGLLGSGVGGHDDDVVLVTTELFYSRFIFPKARTT